MGVPVTSELASEPSLGQPSGPAGYRVQASELPFGQPSGPLLAGGSSADNALDRARRALSEVRELTYWLAFLPYCQLPTSYFHIPYFLLPYSPTGRRGSTHDERTGFPLSHALGRYLLRRPIIPFPSGEQPRSGQSGNERVRTQPRWLARQWASDRWMASALLDVCLLDFAPCFAPSLLPRGSTFGFD